MNQDRAYDQKGKWFLWGMALLGIPSIPFFMGLVHSFAGIATTKATGLAAVAGGIAEAYVMFGLAATLIMPVAAIVFLGKSCSGEHATRTAFAVISIGWSALLLVLYGLAAWMFLVYLPRQGNDMTR